MGERRQIDPEQRLRPQRRNVERPVGQKVGTKQAGVDEGRQQERVEPDRDAGDETGERAARGRAPPDQAAEEHRRELRHRGERQEPDRGELHVAGRAIIEIGQHQDHRDRAAAHLQQHGADVGMAGEEIVAAPQDQRHHQVVRRHDGERDRFDDHHRGRGREPADEGRQPEQIGAGVQRQREHEHVAVGAD